MLADSLNNHPMVYIHKIESRIIPYYYYNLPKFGNLKNPANFKNLLDEFSNNLAFRLCNNNKPFEISCNIEDEDHRNLSTAIDITFSYFAKRENKAIWGDHSPK